MTTQETKNDKMKQAIITKIIKMCRKLNKKKITEDVFKQDFLTLLKEYIENRKTKQNEDNIKELNKQCYDDVMSFLSTIYVKTHNNQIYAYYNTCRYEIQRYYQENPLENVVSETVLDDFYSKVSEIVLNNTNNIYETFLDETWLSSPKNYVEYFDTLAGYYQDFMKFWDILERNVSQEEQQTFIARTSKMLQYAFEIAYKYDLMKECCKVIETTCIITMDVINFSELNAPHLKQCLCETKENFDNNEINKKEFYSKTIDLLEQLDIKLDKSFLKN